MAQPFNGAASRVCKLALPGRRLLQMPRRALLISVGQFEQGGLAKRFAKQLQPDRQLGTRREAAGNAESRNARQIAADKAKAEQVHLPILPGSQR